MEPPTLLQFRFVCEELLPRPGAYHGPAVGLLRAAALAWGSRANKFLATLAAPWCACHPSCDIARLVARTIRNGAYLALT